jgi:transcription-repair coupling factor (superfamily II helicase)
MVQFVQGELDILVATTIVESGLDIPRANTMFVARADAFGLAQLYQLRGRIGRSSARAYCYLLVPEPEHITEEARRRLETLQRFTELGAGFQIASMDLEIRGGGELLGAKQSGSIAAVGFDHYVKMLDAAVAELGGKPSRPRASSLTTTSPIRASGSNCTSGCPRSTTTTSCAT